MKNYLYSILGIFISILLFSYSPSENLSSSEKGFKKIFDGKTLDGWEGDPTYWRVENGSIVGEITPETVLKRNTFIIYRKEQPANFEFKCEVKITKQGNTGINYRSVELLPDLPLGMRGYQADIDGANRFSGQNYEERGRTTLAYRGEIVTINEQTDPSLYENVRSKSQRNAWIDRKVTGSLGHMDSLKTKIKSEDWNEVHIIANGNRLQHFVNGVLMSDVTDLDEINGKKSGFIGVQVHVGPPMKVEYRNIRLKKLK
ncbi:DUF1080 domain-containing protein [Sandaracinomonas limnophila]|jgi:hypothetical protein|uniref:DUF1080 domain-containing protein n=1 Tax=Sandaracinomonas limnophila TaxID=1862386 RepID=A0A437PM94_9BACT|nr:DUF1080 domain-containing protein [Sandaracinomonas limnophila]RVU23395.1 DUF1080 domain-containing protein [Sandaracinomonas limnophila]